MIFLLKYFIILMGSDSHHTSSLKIDRKILVVKFSIFFSNFKFRLPKIQSQPLMASFVVLLQL